jgi:integrase
MSKKRSHGDGGIDPRGPDVWRLRYRINRQRFSTTFHGTLAAARKELRRLLKSGDDGTHVDPTKLTLAAWVEQWIAAGAPGRRQRKVGRRTLKRYEELLRCHIVPVLGARPLQQLRAVEVDAAYRQIESKVAPRTALHTHIVFGAALQTAVRKGLLSANPLDRVERVPSPGEADHGMVLDQDQLRALVDGFRNSVLYPIVALACFTGARRGEILALRWSDLDVEAKTLRIERAVEQIGTILTLKGPKTERGKRTIAIDDDLVALLLAERQKHLRIAAGVPDGVAVDLSLVKLPDGALMFPRSPALGEGFSFTALRNADSLTKVFAKTVCKLGFPDLRFHDLRGSHETLLLDAGVGVHVVAARCGHDPAVLLRSYAKRTRKADTSAAAVIGAMSRGILG